MDTNTIKPNTQNFFPEALKRTLLLEGGINSDPLDSGNAGGNITNKGVTQKTYDSWRTLKGLPKRSTLKITDEEVKTIYKEEFWNRSKAEKMGDKILAHLHFDTAVNSSPKRAMILLQKALGVNPDGHYGPNTEKSLLKTNKKKLIDAYLKLREDYYHRISTEKDNIRFLKGWLNRVDHFRSLTTKTKE